MGRFCVHSGEKDVCAEQPESLPWPQQHKTPTRQSVARGGGGRVITQLIASPCWRLLVIDNAHSPCNTNTPDRPTPNIPTHFLACTMQSLLAASNRPLAACSCWCCAH